MRTRTAAGVAMPPGHRDSNSSSGSESSSRWSLSLAELPALLAIARSPSPSASASRTHRNPSASSLSSDVRLAQSTRAASGRLSTSSDAAQVEEMEKRMSMCTRTASLVPTGSSTSASTCCIPHSTIEPLQLHPHTLPHIMRSPPFGGNSRPLSSPPSHPPPPPPLSPPLENESLQEDCVRSVAVTTTESRFADSQSKPERLATVNTEDCSVCAEMPQCPHSSREDVGCVESLCDNSSQILERVDNRQSIEKV